MKICFIVRSLLNQRTHYTTTHLAFEAYLRGHNVVYTTVNSFSCSDDHRVWATVTCPPPAPVESRKAFLEHFREEEADRAEVCLNDFDVVFIRQNPNDYGAERDISRSPIIYFGRLLKQDGVRVINDPSGLVHAASKTYISHFSTEIRAQTLITRNPERVKQFLDSLKKPAILKPLNGFGGENIFFIKSLKERNINPIISAIGREGYILVQEYLPEAKLGDKRILFYKGSPIFVDGKPAVYRRISPKGEFRSNIHVGGEPKRATFTDADAKIAELIGPQLRKDGLDFVGIDIVGEKLLEVNVFCPGGIHNINELCRINVGNHVIQQLETKESK